MLPEPRLTVRADNVARPPKCQKKSRFRVLKLEERVVPADSLGANSLTKKSPGLA